MASLRFAIQAYAVQEDSPSVILSKLSRLLSVMDTGQLATVLCAAIDLDSHQVTIASAGHLPPLLVTDGRGEFVGGKVGVPVGVEHDATYPSAQVSVSKGATLLAFTDGLVERKHESIDQGLARLRSAAAGNGTPLPELLDRVLGELHNPPAQDDTAIVGLRWTT
jgi:serine phosphatase RsbU (regulator of sigma subunit)